MFLCHKDTARLVVNQGKRKESCVNLRAVVVRFWEVVSPWQIGHGCRELSTVVFALSLVSAVASNWQMVRVTYFGPDHPLAFAPLRSQPTYPPQDRSGDRIVAFDVDLC